MKAQCPLLAARLTPAPVSSTMRIADGHQARAEPPRARGRAFQLTIEEARAVPDVVIGMFPFSIMLVILCYDYVYDSSRYLLSELLS